MRALVFLILFLTAARNDTSVAVVWVDSSTSAATPAVRHGILRSVETGAVPAASVLLSRNEWRAAQAASHAAVSPPGPSGRAAVRRTLGPAAQKWWDQELIGAPERDAVIAAFRIAPPW